jgi:hypothetical protein
MENSSTKTGGNVKAFVHEIVEQLEMFLTLWRKLPKTTKPEIYKALYAEMGNFSRKRTLSFLIYCVVEAMRRDIGEPATWMGNDGKVGWTGSKINTEIYDALYKDAVAHNQGCGDRIDAILKAYLFGETPVNEYGKYWLQLSSDRFQHLGLKKDDSLFLRELSDADSFDEDLLYVWETPDKKRHLAFAYENFGDITLHDNGGSMLRYPRKKVKLRAKVIGVCKPVKIEPEPQEIKPEIINVTCSECKTTLSGTKEFIKGMGWDLRRFEPLCVQCRW